MSACRLRGLTSPATTIARRHSGPLNTAASAVAARGLYIHHTPLANVLQQRNMTLTTASEAATAASPVAKTEEPKPAPAPAPKLSDHDFKIYNQIAVRMDYFVRSPVAAVRFLLTEKKKKKTARKLSTHLEPPLGLRDDQPAAAGPHGQAARPRGPRLWPAPDGAPRHRGAAHVPRAGAAHARV